jgi:hypothetical protein
MCNWIIKTLWEPGKYSVTNNLEGKENSQAKFILIPTQALSRRNAEATGKAGAFNPPKL